MKIDINKYCIVIGAAKSATTYLYNILKAHPEINMATCKQTGFFTNEDLYKKGFKKYNQFFTNKKTAKLKMEVTTNYISNKNCASNIYNKLKNNVKIIIILRNPIDRAFSHYLMEVRFGSEKASFEKAIESEINNFDNYRNTHKFWKKVPRDYVSRGLYYNQLKEYFTLFPSANIKIVIFEEFITDSQKTIKEILEFLNLDTSYKLDFSTQRNKFFTVKSHFFTPLRALIMKIHAIILGGKMMSSKTKMLYFKIFNGIKSYNKPKMIEKSYHLLTNYYMDSIKQLESLIKRDLSIWYDKYK